MADARTKRDSRSVTFYIKDKSTNSNRNSSNDINSSKQNRNSTPIESSNRSSSDVTLRSNLTDRSVSTGSLPSLNSLNETKQIQSFLDALPELSFVVQKVFPWGTKKERILRLSKKGVENVRGQQISSTHSYESIACIEMRDLETFVIHYDGEHDYVYRSPIGMQIVQEISSRVSVRKIAEKKKLTFDIALKYQEKLKQEYDEEQALAQAAERKNSNTDKLKRATKLLNLLGSTEQQRLEVAVNRIVLDASTTEARTINEFINNFHVLMKNPLTVTASVRQFMDGMKDYIIEHRAKELSKLLVEADQGTFQPDEFSLLSMIERVLQRSLIIPLQKRILQCIAHKTADGDTDLAIRLQLLKTKPQAFFGIVAENISPSNYARAVAELNYMNKCVIPSEKLQALLATARSIYGEVNSEKLKQGKKLGFLSADDFLPIFIYVVVNSDLECLETLSEYLYDLCDPDLLNGEGGYYLTVLVSSLQYIRSMKMEQINT